MGCAIRSCVSYVNRLRPLLCVAPLAALLACDATPTAADAEATARYSYADSRGSVHLATTPTSNDDALSGDAVIGRTGGSLQLGRHKLVVPRGAVEHPTRFTMTVETGCNVIVDLSAVDLVTGSAVRTFPVSLQVRLSYMDLALSRDEVRNLVVVWLQDDSPDGTLVPVRTTYLQAERYVIGWVTHFSKYAMGMN